MTRREMAKRYFLKGYNCAQSVALAFSDLADIDEATLAKLASPFGGGMGRLREVCGAVSGMSIIIGLVYGYDSPETGEVKTELYSKVQRLAGEMEEKHGSIVCRDLLGVEAKHEAPEASPRTADFYLKRPCLEIIGDAAEMLERFISQNKT